MAAPTLIEILNRRDQGEQRLSGFFSAFDEDEQFYDGEWEPDGIGDFPITVPATASAIIDEAVDHVDTWNLRAIVPTTGRHVSKELLAGKLKLFIKGMWRYWNTHGSDLAPLRDAVRKGFLSGKMVGKVTIDWDRWPELEVKRGMTNKQKDEAMEDIRAIRDMDFPVTVQSLSPRFFIDDPSIGRKRWGMEVYTKTADDIVANYPNWVRSALTEGEEESARPPEVEMLEYWEEDVVGRKPGCWRAIMAEGEWALEPKWLEGYPLPYVVKYVGLGRESYDSRGGKKARGLLRGVGSLLRAEGRRLTQLDAIIAFYAAPPMVTAAEQGEFEFKWEPGYLNYVGDAKNIPVGIVMPTPHNALIATIATIQQGIERAVGQPILRGAKPTGTRTAGELEVLSAQASLRFLTVSQAAADFAKQVNEKTLKLLRNIILKDGGDIIVPTSEDTLDDPPRLKKSEIPDPFYHRVELGDTSPEARQRQALAAMEKWTRNFIDKETALEEAGYDNPAEVKYKAIRDMVFQSPLLINHLAKIAAEEYLGVDIDAMEFERALIELEKQMGVQRAAQAGQQGGINQAASPVGVSANAGAGGVPTGIQGITEAAVGAQR